MDARTGAAARRTQAVAVDPNDVLVLVPNHFGGLDVCDLFQLILRCGDDDVETVDGLAEEAAIDQTEGWAIVQGGELKMGNLNEIGRVIAKVREANASSDVGGTYWTTQDWEK